MTASVAFVASWAFFYQLTIGTIGFVVAPEIPSQRLRAKTQSFGTVIANILGWAVAFSIPYLVRTHLDVSLNNDFLLTNIVSSPVQP